MVLKGEKLPACDDIATPPAHKVSLKCCGVVGMMGLSYEGDRGSLLYGHACTHLLIGLGHLSPSNRSHNFTSGTLDSVFQTVWSPPLLPQHARNA